MILWWIEIGLLVILIPLAVRAGAKALHSVTEGDTDKGRRSK